MASTNGIEGMWASVKIHTWIELKTYAEQLRVKELLINNYS